MVAPQLFLALFAAKDLDALIDTAFKVVRAAVTCDFVSAFYVSAGNGLLKQRDSRGREYGPAFMRRYMELTPAIPLAMANRGIKISLHARGLPTSTGSCGDIGVLSRNHAGRKAGGTPSRCCSGVTRLPKCRSS